MAPAPISHANITPSTPKSAPSSLQTKPVLIRYYAQLRDSLGLREESVELRWPLSEQEILQFLANQHPSQQKLILASRIAWNDEYLPAGTLVDSADILDVISPVSGG
jgi:molybdopterin converting factor small subunit